MKSIVIGGGCFWCIEAIYQRVRGVEKVVSGYAGGDIDDPTYDNHGTHAEVVQVTYDDQQMKLSTLLEIFFYVHDPTTMNRQGNDTGTQYRSIILTNNDADLVIAQNVRDAATELWPRPIVTEMKLLETFYPAEDYHQDYFNKNPANGYCQVIINPKLAKFEQKFSEYMK